MRCRVNKSVFRWIIDRGYVRVGGRVGTSMDSSRIGPSLTPRARVIIAGPAATRINHEAQRKSSSLGKSGREVGKEGGMRAGVDMRPGVPVRGMCIAEGRGDFVTRRVRVMIVGARDDRAWRSMMEERAAELEG